MNGFREGCGILCVQWLVAGLLKAEPGPFHLGLQGRSLGSHQVDQHQLTAWSQLTCQGTEIGEFAAVIGQ